MQKEKVEILERLRFAVQPKGLVIDDDPNPLLKSIQNY